MAGLRRHHVNAKSWGVFAPRAVFQKCSPTTRTRTAIVREFFHGLINLGCKITKNSAISQILRELAARA